jgi:molybdopterin-guanine dinucleotide biosynthesis protein A
VSAKHDIAGCILAGGQSRRMGEDKARFHLGGVTLLERAIGRLGPQVASVIINVHEEAPGPDRYGLPVVEDAEGEHQGPLAGLLAALSWARDNHFAWIATAAVDTPFFPRDLVPRLAEAARGRDVAVARSGGRLHPVFGLWRATLASDLAEFIEDGSRSARHWADRNDAAVAEWPARPYDPFFNINEPKDVSAALLIEAEFHP